MHIPTRLIAAAAGALLLMSPAPILAMGGDAPDTGGQDKYSEAVQAVKAKDFKTAIRLLREVIADDSTNADALNYLGYSLRKTGDYDQALKFYWRALAQKPDHRGANEYIGEAYLELNQPVKAKEHLDRLARICGPDCEEYRVLKKAWDAYQAKMKMKSS